METILLACDGSFDRKTMRGGWAFAVIEDNKVIHSQSGVVEGELNSIWQVGSEITAVVKAVEYCKLNNKKAIIQYDLKNLYHWVADLFGKKPWRCGNKFSAQYRSFIIQNKGYIEKFQKVKGHSGVFGNECADGLAKAALGLK